MSKRIINRSRAIELRTSKNMSYGEIGKVLAEEDGRAVPYSYGTIVKAVHRSLDAANQKPKVFKVRPDMSGL